MRPLAMRWSAACILVAVLALLMTASAPGQALLGMAAPAESTQGRPAPEFPSLDPKSWAGTPTSLASLRGRVVLLNVWTFGCVNCERTLPWILAVASRYKGQRVSIIGVHSPELDFERDPHAVEEARHRQKLDYPSFIDNGHAYWRAIENHYWPTVYLIDAAGRIRAVQVGEIHEGDDAARSLEAKIDALLKTP